MSSNFNNIEFINEMLYNNYIEIIICKPFNKHYCTIYELSFYINFIIPKSLLDACKENNRIDNLPSYNEVLKL